MTAPEDQAPDAPETTSPAEETVAPELSAQEAAQIAATNQQNRRTAMIGGLFVVILIVVIAVLLLWLRGCGSSTVTTKPSSTESSATVAADAAVDLANRVHTVLHPLQLPNKKLLDTTIYIIDISRDKGVVATIRLVASVADINKALGGGSAQTIAATCEKTTLAGVPEIDTVRVVDFSGAPVSSQSRQ